MTGGMYTVADDGTLAAMRERPFETEAVLQILLTRYPDLLSGDQVDAAPRRWMLVQKEAPLAASVGGNYLWAIDHLFLDQDAIPTIVEVKRSVDTRIRREVVGQMLDYAANGVMYWDIDRLRGMFEATCAKDGVDPTGQIGALLGEPDPDADLFWSKVEANLRAGNIRLTFVADEIPDKLRRIIVFLGEQMRPAQVVAVEVKEFVSDRGHRTLTAKVVCQTPRAEQSRNSGVARVSQQWDDAKFLSKIEEKGGAAIADLAGEIIRRAASEGMQIDFGKGSAEAVFRPFVEIHGIRLTPFTLHDYTGGTVELRVENIKKHPPFTAPMKRSELIDCINAIPGVALQADRLESRPSFSMSLLSDQRAMDQFFAAIAWCIAAIRHA